MRLIGLYLSLLWTLIEISPRGVIVIICLLVGFLEVFGGIFAVVVEFFPVSFLLAWLLHNVKR